MRKFLIILIVLGIVCIRYWYMPLIFFVQDEWFVFGSFIGQGPSVIFSGLDRQGLAHFVPISKSISFLIYKLFGVNDLPYNLFGLIIHLVNSFIIYLIAKKYNNYVLISEKKEKSKINFFNRDLISTVPAVLFFCSSIGYEQIAWPMVSINALSLTFSLLAWYLLIGEEKEPSYRKIILSAVLVFAGLFVVEYTVSMFFFLPLFLLLISWKKFSYDFLKKELVIISSFISYFLFRIITVSQQTLIKSASIKWHFLSFHNLAHLGSLPFRYLTESFLPQSIILFISQKIAARIYHDQDQSELFAENKVFIFLAFLVGLIVLVSFQLMISKDRTKKSSILEAPLLFLICSCLPFLFVPGLSSDLTIIPSRYLYFGVAGSSLILGFLISILISNKKTHAALLVLSFVTLSIIWGLIDNFQINKHFFQLGKTRQTILLTIIRSYPTTAKKVVFYTQSDTAYYGVDAKILPFQSGFGQTLQIWYYTHGSQIPRQFFNNRFLWEITDQGYKEYDKRGFGYFRDYNFLLQALKKNHLSADSLISFDWKDRSFSLEDTTLKTRGKVMTEENRTK